MAELYGYFDYFCNNCGQKNNVRADGMGAWGREWKTCDRKCHEELELKRVKVLINKQPEKEHG